MVFLKFYVIQKIVVLVCLFSNTESKRELAKENSATHVISVLNRYIEKP